MAEVVQELTEELQSCSFRRLKFDKGFSSRSRNLRDGKQQGSMSSQHQQAMTLYRHPIVYLIIVST